MTSALRLRVGSRQDALERPVSEAPAENLLTDPHSASPIGTAQRLAGRGVSKPDGASPVRRLNLRRRPAKITGLVVPVGVDAIERMFLARSRAEVGVDPVAEGREVRDPRIVQLDPTGSVPPPSAAASRDAPLLDADPDAVEVGPRIRSEPAQRSVGCRGSLALPAGQGAPAKEPACLDDGLPTARAPDANATALAKDLYHRSQAVLRADYHHEHTIAGYAVCGKGN